MKFSNYLAWILLCSLHSVLGYLEPWPQSPLPGHPAPVGSLWPQPRVQNSIENVFTIDHDNFETILLEQGTNMPISCPTLDFARTHYTQLVKDFNTGTANNTFDVLTTLRIELATCDEDFATDKLESYELTVKFEPSSNQVIATLTAQVPLGVIRGLETFYQLMWYTESMDDISPVFINETLIEDSARFPHRGILLDSSRHYLPEETIMQVLTIMMYNKFNVFHWHIIDDQSFPYVSLKFPELSAKGAYHSGAIYTPETMNRIVEGARVRGIRVIFEFESPGHAGGIGKSHPELLTPCYGDGVNPGSPGFPRFAAYENIDPTNEAVYEFMREFFTEFVENIGKDEFVHLGMDEVYYPCWQSSPIIKGFMIAHGFTEYFQVQEWYTKRHIEMVKSLGVTPIIWEDPFREGVELDKDIVLHVWRYWPESFQEILQKGHRVLLSECWYLDYIDYGQTWKEYYQCDPILDANVTEAQRDQVLGGEVCLWAEYVDETNVIPRLFPFGSAVAEVLWTERTEVSTQLTDDAMWRLDQFRCSLRRRGVPAQPLVSGHCGSFQPKKIK